MSWDLWGPPDNRVELESGNGVIVQPPRCDFRAGFGVDVIEEDVLNDKSCVQVLRILIAKADAEIDDLEERLVSLQCAFFSAELLHNRLPCLQLAVETRLGTSGLNAQLTSASDSDRQEEPTANASETATEELFQQLTDVVVEVNTPNILEKKFEAKFGASEDTVIQPTTSNIIHNSGDEIGNTKSAETDETRGLSLEREDRKEDGKFPLTSFAHLQDQGSKNMSDSQTCKEEVQPAEFVEWNEVTMSDKSKWALQLFKQRPELKRKNGLGAERSPFPRKEHCSLTSKAKLGTQFGIKHSSFNKSTRENMRKGMILALSASPLQEKEEILQVSERKTKASVYTDSPVSKRKGADDTVLKEGPPPTQSDKLHKQLVKSAGAAEEVNLEYLKVKDLRAIAKQNKIKQYSKLPKKQLVEKIASSLEPQ